MTDREGAGGRSPLRQTRVLIVDDEEPARTLLREMLEELPGVRLLQECDNGFEAVRAAAELKPDMVLLDIEMPKLNGFEVAELLDPSIAVVFVTAYDKYAVKAFEIHAVDYVLKPFRAERLAEALKRAQERSRRDVAPADLARSALPPGRYLERIAVRDGSRVQLIAVAKLDYAQAEDDFIALKSDGKKYLKTQTLASLAEALDPGRFVRVHRSFLVNLDRIQAVELYAKNSHAAILSDGTRIPVSREGHTRLKKLLGDTSE